MICTTQNDYVVLMDSFGGDWTPVAIMSDEAEAESAKRLLSKDAECVCESAPYYATPGDAKQKQESKPPSGLKSLIVVFDGSDVLAISDADMTAREIQIEKGGLRTGVQIHHTANELVKSHPAVNGQFISSDITASDMLNNME